MFKFEFDLDVLEEQHPSLEPHPQAPKHIHHHSPQLTTPQDHQNLRSQSVPCTQISFHQLIRNLPPFITYSTLHITPTESIYKRELYDAKYQTYLAARPDSHPPPTHLQAPSDLVPGVYEGGYKTWECSYDLAVGLAEVSDRLIDHMRHATATGRGETVKVLEIGCGTAVPTLSLCFKLFCELLGIDHQQCAQGQSSIVEGNEKELALEIILQDFNSDVLQLLTFPNLLLAFYRARLVVQGGSRDGGTDEPRGPLEQTEDLELTDELKSDFTGFLAKHRIGFRLIYGPWTSFSPEKCQVVYSSETIYAPGSLEAFVELLLRGHEMVLVAAKKVYFGVGGGSRSLIEAVEAKGGNVEVIETDGVGVGRVLMKVRFP